MFRRFFNWIKRMFKPASRPSPVEHKPAPAPVKPTQDVPPVSEANTAPSPDKLTGEFIDISHWVDVDFNELPLKDVIMKATEGSSHIDSKLLSNIIECKKYNKRIGFYHYYRVRSNPKAQAAHFVETVGLNIFKSCYHLPVIDLERGGNYSDKELVRALPDVKVFAEEILRLTGRKCRMYTNDGLMRLFAKEMARLNLDDVCGSPWIARYPDTPKNVSPWKEMWAHQYTESGRIKGSPDKVDLNRFK